jgi:hypothetical protein
MDPSKVARYQIFDLKGEEAIRLYSKMNQWKSLLEQSGSMGNYLSNW